MMHECQGCNWSGLPERKVCPRCYGVLWNRVNSVTGTVVATTNVHRSFGDNLDPAQPYALIAAHNGGFFITHNELDLVEGVHVVVDQLMGIHPTN